MSDIQEFHTPRPDDHALPDRDAPADREPPPVRDAPPNDVAQPNGFAPPGGVAQPNGVAQPGRDVPGADPPDERSGRDDAWLNLEPMVGLEWSQAIALPLVTGDAASPADLRVAWVHRAPLDQVLALYRAAGGGDASVPSPWWLRALADGTLDSREAGFRIEDRVHNLLSRRPGWEFVPWAAGGESGYWEFMPSEGTGGNRRTPTTIVNTSRHTGWIDMFPAHEAAAPDPVAIDGPAALRARLGEIEAVR